MTPGIYPSPVGLYATLYATPAPLSLPEPETTPEDAENIVLDTPNALLRVVLNFGEGALMVGLASDLYATLYATRPDQERFRARYSSTSPAGITPSPAFSIPRRLSASVTHR